MSKPWKRAPLTVRRRSVGLPVLWCLLASALTAVVVYRWGREHWTPVAAGPAYTATAYVVEGPADGSPRPTNLRSVPGEGPGLRASSAAPSDIESLSAGRPHPNPLPKGEGIGSQRVPFTASDDDAERAAEAANGLAAGYVSQRRAEWQRRTEGACAKARQGAETAQRQLAQCEADLDTFRRQLAEAAAKPQAAGQPQEKPLLPPMVDNPQWNALQDELSGLRQRREELLLKRTPQHPAVQDVSRRIAGVEEQLAATERQIPNPQAEGAVQNVPLTLRVREARHAERDEYNKGEHEKRENQARLDALTAAAAAARQACRQAELVGQQAVREQDGGPRLAVESAEVVRNPLKVDYGWWRLLGTALGSGLVMAFGAGSLALGVGIESPEVSVAEVQADLGEPLLGVIPADDPARTAAKVNRQRRVRRAAITVGLLLMAVCPLVAVWGVLGI